MKTVTDVYDPLLPMYMGQTSRRGVMPVRVPPKLQRRRKGHDGVVDLPFETSSIKIWLFQSLLKVLLYLLPVF